MANEPGFWCYPVQWPATLTSSQLDKIHSLGLRVRSNIINVPQSSASSFAHCQLASGLPAS